MQRHRVIRSGEIGRIRLPLRFDVVSSATFRSSFVRLLDDAGLRTLVVDFSDLQYIDSLGIGTLLSWDCYCKASGKTLIIDNCAPETVGLFRLAGADRLLKFS